MKCNLGSSLLCDMTPSLIKIRQQKFWLPCFGSFTLLSQHLGECFIILKEERKKKSSILALVLLSLCWYLVQCRGPKLSLV